MPRALSQVTSFSPRSSPMPRTFAAQQPDAEDEVPRTQEAAQVGTLAHAQLLGGARGGRDQRQPEPHANPAHRPRKPVLVRHPPLHSTVDATIVG
ncbi:MAG: hypothetical protein K0R44_3443 [Thermomicrobiales bacterium]|nr:hypothetical protein [Thermomicrobiales bacterium]